MACLWAAEAINKLTRLKASYAGDRKVYTTVDEFMADRQMLIDLVVARRQNLRVSWLITNLLQLPMSHLFAI